MKKDFPTKNKMNQSKRLTGQHKKSHGASGIFGQEAKIHDIMIRCVVELLLSYLRENYPQLSFRHRTSINKEEINSALKKIDSEYEDRYQIIGTTEGDFRLLLVIYVERELVNGNENVYRIISARDANRKEKDTYVMGISGDVSTYEG